MSARSARGDRAAASEKRRRDILAAALHCFTELGYAGTTMQDIRTRARASTGSLYHHFSSKEQLAGELYLEGIRQVQEAGLTELVAHRSAERGIRAVVRWYLRWIRENARLASFLFDHRYAEFATRGGELERLNEKLRARVGTWLRRHVESGALPELPMEMYWALLVGPSDFVARRRLREGRPEEIERYAQILAHATWGAFQGVLGARSRRRGPA